MPNHASFSPLLDHTRMSISVTAKRETRLWYSVSQYKKYCLGNSSVTHEIAKIDNYSVYRWFGINFDYTTTRHEITIILPMTLRGAYFKIRLNRQITNTCTLTLKSSNANMKGCFRFLISFIYLVYFEEKVLCSKKSINVSVDFELKFLYFYLFTILNHSLIFSTFFFYDIPMFVNSFLLRRD